jgi:acetylornithine deacetylase/succinyl-diaminopimelate desuccinylase-like protein
MILSRRAIVVVAILTLSISVQCRRASGGDTDPLDREAESAFQEYLRIDTTNPPGHETAGARFLQQLLTKEGIEVRLLGSDPERQSLYARLRAGASAKPNEKALLLLHHIDVVPAPKSEWTKPAFAGLKTGGYFWGRGALDIKSLGIAEAMAMIDLKRRAVALRRDIIYLAVADEEMGGLRGCKEILDTHPELFADVGYVLNEGGYNETVVDKVVFWGIEVSQKVPLWLRLTARGAAGHSASPPDNGGSVAQLLRALDAVESIPTPYRLESSVARYFKALGRTKHDYRGEIMLAMKEPLDVDRVKALSPGYRSLLRDTIAFTRISGGSSVNSIPAQASCDVDIRLLPDEAPGAMLARVREAVGKLAEVEVILEGRQVGETPADTYLFRTLASEMRKGEPGSAVAPTVGAGTSDSRFFRERGIVAYGIAPFKVNYYDADTVHGPDERIRERFFMEGTRLMRRIVASFCVRAE